MSTDPSAQVGDVLGRAGLFGSPTTLAVTSPATGRWSWASGTLTTTPSMPPVTPRTTMYAASVTKQVLGVLVARAVASAKLEARCRVGDVVPSLPTWAAPLTVRHLLHHTSGVPTTRRVLVALGVSEESRLDNELVLEGLRRLGTPEDEPGRTFRYSNVGYVLLAETLQVVCGTDVPALAASVFGELGLRASRVGGPPAVVLDEHPRPPRTVGDGGLWTTADDLLTWLDALNHRRLGDEVTDLVQNPGRLDDGTGLTYAWGTSVRLGARSTTFTHGGDWSGWAAKTLRNPGRRTAVALLTCHPDAQAVSDAGDAIHELLLSRSD